MESILIPTLSTPTQSHGHQVIDFSVTGQFTLGHAQNKNSYINLFFKVVTKMNFK